MNERRSPYQSQNGLAELAFPISLGNFQSLRYLNLSYASFFGEILHSLGNLSNLNYLALHYSRHSNELEESPSSKSLNWFSHLSSPKYLNLGGVDLSSIGVSWLHTVNMFLHCQSYICLHVALTKTSFHSHCRPSTHITLSSICLRKFSILRFPAGFLI